jgi:hypothetical protein
MKLFGRECECQSPDEAPPACDACGRPLRYRGRRRSMTVWECTDPACPVVLVERLEPARARRPGGIR